VPRRMGMSYSWVAPMDRGWSSCLMRMRLEKLSPKPIPGLAGHGLPVNFFGWHLLVLTVVYPASKQ
jgi:hypothetical protein